MKLTVIFAQHPTSTAMPIFIRETPAGLDLVDMARNVAGLPKLNLELFDSVVPELKTGVKIEIDEISARASGHFSEFSTFVVTVPGLELNKYVTTHPLFYRDGGDGKITRVAFERKIDTAAIFMNWVSYGYPKEWPISKPINGISDAK